MDYANKNGIQVNLVYEDNKTEMKKPEAVTKAPIKRDFPPSKYQKYPNPEGTSDSYHKYKGGYSSKPRKPVQKFGNNKFDLCNSHIPKMTVYDPFVMQEYNQQGFVPQQNMIMQKPVPVIKEDEEILQFLVHFFSIENLNQDMYVRNRINEDGYAKVEEIANFNAMKHNGISAEKIAEVAKVASDYLEDKISKEGGNLIRNKDWEALKESLFTKDQISANKRIMKRNEKIAMSE